VWLRHLRAACGVHKRGSDPSNIFAGEICALKIELWDSGLPVSAHAGDTLPTLAATYHVPLWVLTQVNNLSEAAALTKGARIIVPRYLVPTAALSAVSSQAASNKR